MVEVRGAGGLAEVAPIQVAVGQELMQETNEKVSIMITIMNRARLSTRVLVCALLHLGCGIESWSPSTTLPLRSFSPWLRSGVALKPSGFIPSIRSLIASVQAQNLLTSSLIR